MPRKITDPLTSGLPAKILLLAFIQPKTGYRLAQEIYQRKSPPTSKIYTWCKTLIEQGYLERTPEGYRTKHDKILDAIETTLRKKELLLTFSERQLLTTLLNSDKFRRAIRFSSPVSKEKGTKFEGELNFIDIVCTFLTQTIVPIMYRRNMQNQIIKDISEDKFRQLADKDTELDRKRLENLVSGMFIDRRIARIFQQRFGEMLKEELVEEVKGDIEYLSSAFLLLELLPSSLLEKLERLNEDMRLMQLSHCIMMTTQESFIASIKEQSSTKQQM